MTRTSLPACAKRHPDVPSVITTKMCSRKGGASFERSYCSVCKAAIAKAQERDRKALSQQGIDAPSALEPYGVHRFDWLPPERLLDVA